MEFFEETKKLKFIILGIPQSKQSARFRAVKSGNKTFVMSYQKKEVKDNEYNIKTMILSQLESGFKPFSGGIRINKLIYVFPPLKSFNKGLREVVDRGLKEVPKTTKPDLTDNLQKGLFDAMEGIVFINDSQICEMNNVKKIYGNRPRIEIELEEII